MSWHINRSGLSNDIISELMDSLTATRRYLGVIPWTNIPTRKIMKRVREQKEGQKPQDDYLHTIAFIVNVGAHFVSVVIKPECILYLDSFANPISPALYPLLTRIRAEKRDNYPLYCNRNQIQSLLSSHCGLYAALFTTWYLTPPTMRMQMQFEDTNLLRNDTKCVKYLKQFVRQTL